MLSRFSSLKKYIKSSRHLAEDFQFYLHYRVTFLLLFFCCIIVTPQLMFGEPIVCTKPLPSKHIVREVIHAYCWAHGTYSIASAYGKQIDKDIPHVGIDTSEDETKFIYWDYYQYIYFILFIQATLFYVPHGLWKYFENGKLQKLIKKLEEIQAKDEDEDKKNVKAAKHIHKLWGSHYKYALQYTFCNILSLLNIVVQVLFLNQVFREEFITLGLRLFQGLSYRELMNRVFPRVTRCHFNQYGMIGAVDTVDVLCTLPLNALNEKIYIVTWFWYLALFSLSCLNLLYTVLCLFFSKLRAIHLLCSTRVYNFWSSYSLEPSDSSLFQVVQESNFGDWFVISAVSTTINRYYFNCIISKLNDIISNQAQNNGTNLEEITSETTKPKKLM